MSARAEDIVERLTDWTSRHSNVTPLDGTDRDSPTFGDLRALLSALKEREERLARYSKPPKVYFTASIGTTELTLRRRGESDATLTERGREVAAALRSHMKEGK